MKKYFSFFTTSFMVLEACFIAGSSLSYAMEEFDESQNIVISNSRGQKTLHQEDPAADLRLNPFRGETLWFEEKQIWCHHPYLDGKVYSFQYPELIEITLSPIARFVDCLKVRIGLYNYNLEKIEDFSSSFLSTPYTKDAIAEVLQESLILEFDNVLSQIGLEKYSIINRC